MDWSRHHFHSLWSLPAPPTAVYAVLERVEDYPHWWPQVRSVARLDDTTGVLIIRSALPYAISLIARAARRDPDAGVLEVAVTGDIEGWARWTVTAGGAGTLARFEQVVDVRKTLLRRLAVPGRPVFRANHRLMMRAGRSGLLRHLEAV